MRHPISSTALIIGLVAVLGTTTGKADDTPVPGSCDICTCQNDAVICLSGVVDVLEDQGVCSGPCASVNSSFKSRELVETACENLPACDHAETPAASPLLLSAGMLGLLLLGVATLRRIGARTQN